MSGAMTLAEVAAELGKSADRLRKTWRRHVDAGMPAPISSVGRPTWDRASFMAWKRRNHPLAPARPANDTAPPVVPASDAEHRAFLATVYGGRT